MSCKDCMKRGRALIERDPVPEPVDRIERVYLINLDGRQDRLSEFERDLPVDWPLPPIIRFPAVVGKKVPMPGWWKAGAGGWGCYLSHMRIFEEILQDGVQGALILEDDVIWRQDFGSRVRTFFRNLPADWEQAYLGGQFLKQRKRSVQKVADHVVRPFNVNRTHAYAVSEAGARKLYAWLTDWDRWRAEDPRNHIDHQMGSAHEKGRVNVYACFPWVAGQRAGTKSDVAGGVSKGNKFWQVGDPDGTPLPDFFPVIGLHRSGSSLLARMMVELGIHMGNRLGGFEERRVGGSEAQGLAVLCEKYMRFPSLKPTGTRQEAREELREWIRDRRQEAANKGTVAGAKYPHLCAMGNLLDSVCPDAKPIHIWRPLEDSIRSLQARSRSVMPRGSWLAASDEQCEKLQRFLWDHKESYLGNKVHLTIKYDDLLSDPRRQVDRLIEWTGIKPTAGQVEAAIGLVDPALNRHGSRPKPTVEVLS